MSVHTDFSYLRGQVSRVNDVERLNEIEHDRQRILRRDAVITDTDFFDIMFGDLTFCLRRDLAPSSLDTYVEIFRDMAHMKLPGFQADNCYSILDIGANEGYYSIFMKHHNPTLKIYSVEPVPDTFDILQRNIRANGFNDIEIMNAAVSDREGRRFMEVYPHVSSISAEDIMLQNLPWTDPGRIRRIPVSNMTLHAIFDAFNLKTIDVVKLDVEGSEMKILESAGDILDRINKLVVEWHTPEIREQCRRFLTDGNFRLLYEERRRCGDSYFVNNNVPHHR